MKKNRQIIRVEIGQNNTEIWYSGKIIKNITSAILTTIDHLEAVLEKEKKEKEVE